MLLKTWRFVAIMLTALSMATAFAHLLEMPAKLRIDGAMWLTLLQTLYPPAFGPVGGTCEGGALVTTNGLAVYVRHRQPVFGWTLLAAVFLIATHAAFWLLVQPVNATMGPLTSATLPADWMQLRGQWEYTHAARALMQIVALGALVVSVLVDTPSSNARAHRT
jgi:hypothetical protein